MSTKCTISHGESFHLYNECFDSDNVYLSLEKTAYEVSNNKVTVTIPIYIWETIRHKGAPDLSKADLTDEQLLQDVETEVDARIKQYQEAPIDNKRLKSWLNFCGSLIFGGAETPREEQIKLGMEHCIEERNRQKTIKDKIEELKKGNQTNE